MRYAMIMAGGAGTRLWPMSRLLRPKQLLPLIDGHSLIEEAASRLEGLVDQSRRLICTAEAFRGAIRETLPAFDDDHILGEPVGRDTVNAVGLTAAVLAARDPDAVFAVLTADHIITPQEEFARKLETGFQLAEAEPDRFITFGIKATEPATGYGYIERGDAIPGHADAYQCLRFVEKPIKSVAESYIKAGTFSWNSGMFVFHAGAFMRAIEQFMPENHTGLTKIAAAWDTPERQDVLSAVYPTLPRKSVDFGVMEHASSEGPPSPFSIGIVTMAVDWTDVGSFPSYAETLVADETGSRSNARVKHLGSRNIIALSDDPNHTITTIGCEDLIIVRTADATLVLKAEDAQRVKEMAQAVEEPLQ